MGTWGAMLDVVTGLLPLTIPGGFRGEIQASEQA